MGQEKSRLHSTLDLSLTSGKPRGEILVTMQLYASHLVGPANEDAAPGSWRLSLDVPRTPAGLLVHSIPTEAVPISYDFVGVLVIAWFRC